MGTTVWSHESGGGSLGLRVVGVVAVFAPSFLLLLVSLHQLEEGVALVVVLALSCDWLVVLVVGRPPRTGLCRRV